MSLLCHGIFANKDWTNQQLLAIVYYILDSQNDDASDFIRNFLISGMDFSWYKSSNTLHKSEVKLANHRPLKITLQVAFGLRRYNNNGPTIP